jgi:asparagine synthase (glutamine-hydrolysing)
VVDWAFSLSSRYKLRGGQGKYLLKRAAHGSVPDEVIHRPKKGFAIPLARWLAGPLRPRLDALVARSPVWDLGVLNQPAFAAFHNEHQNHRRDRSKPLWALLVLDHWVRRLPSFYRPGGGSHVERTNAAARASDGLGPRP